MNIKWIWIDTEKKREKARNHIGTLSLIGMDTEYDSFRYFREKLCLIQIAAGPVTYLFDPLDTTDITFLGKVFADQNVLKIMHACDNDIRLLNRDYGFKFKNIFDTHRAASILGSTSLSLTSVILEYLGVELEKSKSIQRSLWDKRPLTEEQITYAVYDTDYLMDLYLKLKQELTRRGLEEKAREAFDKLLSARWTEKTLNPDGYLKVKGCETLNGFQRVRLKALFRWRFEKAKKTNRARFLVLSDKNLIDLSKISTINTGSIDEAGILSPQKVRDYGKEITRILSDYTL
ncbi:MAG: ribonuclease D [Deltaproteobacteria bacterium]|nr:ribonuclease D [Deltaproteobacteria bacterium]MBN2845504.1 ribonuclease D [Deltaproteobacteria bacterium]